jgi:hypothetical protein
LSGHIRFFYVGHDLESELTNIDNMAVSAMRHYQGWTPETIDNLHLDSAGYDGLEFHYDAIQEYIKQIKSKKVGS